MNRSSSLTVALVAAAILATAVVESLAQIATISDPQQPEPVMSRLSPPIYPPLAKQARITGDVNLVLAVRQDGSIQSAAAGSGHPLLKQAALISAQQSRFECRNCSEMVTSLPIVYSFQLGPTEYCSATVPAPNDRKPEQHYPQVMQLQNHITVIDQPIGTCDMAPVLKVRSAKCLYLWKCGIRYIL
jgi:TonB-like protein